MPSGRFLLCRDNRHRDLRHVGRGVVADDIVDEGDPANRCRPRAIRDSCRAEGPHNDGSPLRRSLYINININVYT